MGKKKRVKLICKQCEEEFEVIPSRANKAKFCSCKCHGLWNSENRRGENSANWRGGNAKLICEQCEKEFEVIPARTDKARFCSYECRDQENSKSRCGENHPRWREKDGLICEYCGEEFEAIPSHASRRRFCSYGCWNQWRSENQCGENNPNWQGGTSFKPYTAEWTEELKEEIRRRDKYTCAMSNEVWQSNQPTFHVHHIDGNKKNCARRNLITLTPNNHAKINSNPHHWQAPLTHIAKGAEMRANAFIKLGREA